VDAPRLTGDPGGYKEDELLVSNLASLSTATDFRILELVFRSNRLTIFAADG